MANHDGETAVAVVQCLCEDYGLQVSTIAEHFGVHPCVFYKAMRRGSMAPKSADRVLSGDIGDLLTFRRDAARIIHELVDGGVPLVRITEELGIAIATLQQFLGGRRLKDATCRRVIDAGVDVQDVIENERIRAGGMPELIRYEMEHFRMFYEEPVARSRVAKAYGLEVSTVNSYLYQAKAAA